MPVKQAHTKRIAKNTLVLYFRMLFLMAISLYTSRVILETLGVENFGVYNVVGGFVAMFAVLNKSLSSACSRFLNYMMGRNDPEKLSKVFSTSVVIHLGMAFLVAVLCEIVGTWFLDEKMVIDVSRVNAAHWVLHFSILTFAINLISVPYNAAIIAHERMKTFAYVSLYEGIAKLGISFLILVSPIDSLIFYAALLCLLQLSVRFLYQYYCRKSFEECRLKFIYDKTLLKELVSFAGWNFIGSSSAILRNHGGNVLVNLFFGPVANAARAVANQVLHAVEGFVSNFMTAVKPQITQSYASGDRAFMMSLIYKSARLSYYMLLFLSLPILLNTDFLLHLWLKSVPQNSVVFVQLTLAFSMVESLSHPLVTAQQATGNIRNYQIVVGGLQLLNLPISYLVYKMGGPAESFLIVAICCSIACLAARLFMLRYSIKLDSLNFIKKVIFNVVIVTFLAAIGPYAVRLYFGETFFAFVCVSLVSLLSAGVVILLVGCEKEERALVFSLVKKIKKKLFCRE